MLVNRGIGDNQHEVHLLLGHRGQQLLSQTSLQKEVGRTIPRYPDLLHARIMQVEIYETHLAQANADDEQGQDY